MALSTLTAITQIPERSDATPGLWNARFAQIDANFASAQSVLNNASLVTQLWPSRSSETGVVDVRWPYGHARRYGVMADGVTEDSASMQTTVRNALALNVKCLVPAAPIKLSTVVKISNADTPNWSAFELEGEMVLSAAGLSQSGDQATVFVTNGNNAFEVEYYNFNNESVKFRNVDFHNSSSTYSGVGVQLKKSSVGYPRKIFFTDCNAYRMDGLAQFVGLNASIFDNFFGTTQFARCHTYLTRYGIRITDAYLNLAELATCLFHGTATGGVLCDAGSMALTGGGDFAIRDSHFEGCEPAGLVTGGRISHIALHNVTSELCGVLSGNGRWKAAQNTVLRLSGNGPVPGTSEPTPSLSSFCELYSTIPVTVLGDGGLVGTPETVTLSADSSHTVSYAYFPLERNVGAFRSASTWPYTVTVGGVNIPATVASDYSFTSDLTLYSLSTRSIGALSSPAYVVATFVEKVVDGGNEGFNVGTTANVGGQANTVSPAFGLQKGVPLVAQVVWYQPANSLVTNLGIVYRTGDFASSVYVSQESVLRTMQGWGHPVNRPIGALADGTALAPSLRFASETSLGLYRSGASTIAASYGTLNLATNSVRLSLRTLAASSVTASAAQTNVAVNEVVFTIGGASGASFGIMSGGTFYYFNSAGSAKQT